MTKGDKEAENGEQQIPEATKPAAPVVVKIDAKALEQKIVPAKIEESLTGVTKAEEKAALKESKAIA